MVREIVSSPAFWWTIKWLAFLLMSIYLVKPVSLRINADKVTLTGLVILLFLGRFALLFYNRQINPDESQLLSQALTLRYHPIYWQSTDGATMGPLSSYAVALPGYLGLPLNYIVLRWLSLGFLAVTLISGYFTIKNLFGQRPAQLAAYVMTIFLAFVQDPDFVHATNEQLSLMLLGLSGWQLSRLYRARNFANPSGLFLLAFLSSLVPFAKLQGTPTALALVAAGLVGLFLEQRQRSRPRYGRALLALIAGGLLFPVLVVVLTIQFGVFDDFIQFYIVGNARYSSSGTFWDHLFEFPAFVAGITDFLIYLAFSVVLLVFWLISSRQRSQEQYPLFVTLFVLSVSLYAVVKPGNQFVHYLYYLVLPLSLLNAWLIAHTSTPSLPAVLVGSVVVLTAVKLMLPASAFPPESSFVPQSPFGNRQMALSKAAQLIHRYARPGEDLVVWGYLPRLNVETQMPQGVCDNHTIRCVFGPPEEYQVHRTRYIKNIEYSVPPVFVDAVGSSSTWLNDRKAFGYEVFPQLRNFVDAHYRYVGMADDTRVFVRADRYQLLTSNQAEK